MNLFSANRSLLLSALLTTGVAGCQEPGPPVLEGQVETHGGPIVVFLNGVTGDTAGMDTVITHQPGGAFEPAVSIGFVGGDFVLRNDDDRLHTTHLYLHLAYQKELSDRPIENGATLYNIAFPTKGMEVRRPIKRYHQLDEATGAIDVRCNPHPGERATVLIFDHPYAAIASADGSFSLPNVPAGKHDLWVWRDGKARLWKQVDVLAQGPTRVAMDGES